MMVGGNNKLLATQVVRYIYSVYADSPIIGACAEVYPGVTHLLCRWHVDRYADSLKRDTIQPVCVYGVQKCNHLTIGCFTLRAWQRKLHALVQDDSHKAEIYKYLWMLMTEGDPEVFQQNMEGFMKFWETKQPRFISYFKEYYSNRVGMLIAKMHQQNMYFILASVTCRKVGTGL